jgi:hypothetical protein
MDCAKLEPLTFSIGDSLRFDRYFPQFLPSAGWQLQYQIVGGANKRDGLPNTAFVSTPDATNTVHEINVAAATTTVWAAGEYVLAGYAVNAELAKRVEIYQGTIILTPNFNTAQDNGTVQTHAQQMICKIENALLVLADFTIQATTVQQTEIIRVKRQDLDRQLAFYREKRANEVAIENVRNGRPSGNRIVPQMNVVSPGCSRGAWGNWPFPQ